MNILKTCYRARAIDNAILTKGLGRKLGMQPTKYRTKRKSIQHTLTHPIYTHIHTHARTQTIRLSRCLSLSAARPPASGSFLSSCRGENSSSHRISNSETTNCRTESDLFARTVRFIQTGIVCRGTKLHVGAIPRRVTFRARIAAILFPLPSLPAFSLF